MEAAAVQTAKDSSPSAGDVSEATPLARFGWLPCQLSLEIPIRRFTVGDLLRLTKGSVVASDTNYTSDIPIRVNGLVIGWTEFEVVGNCLAVRLTELA
jgi:flagellar motor switch/type III secretory pathway protein FliN